MGEVSLELETLITETLISAPQAKQGVGGGGGRARDSDPQTRPAVIFLYLFENET